MKNFFKKLTGLDKVEAQKAEVESEKMELLKKKDPKAYATKKKQPWVSVLDVKVNQENVRNGFFEMDWNEYFMLCFIDAIMYNYAAIRSRPKYKFILKKLINLVGFKKKSKTVKFTTLKLSEFLQLNVEAKNSINWSLRKPHLDIVTKNKRYIKVDEIIKYLKRCSIYDWIFRISGDVGL